MARGLGVVLLWLALDVAFADITCNTSDPMALLQRRARPRRETEGDLEHATSQDSIAQLLQQQKSELMADLKAEMKEILQAGIPRQQGQLPSRQRSGLGHQDMFENCGRPKSTVQSTVKRGNRSSSKWSSCPASEYPMFMVGTSTQPGQVFCCSPGTLNCGGCAAFVGNSCLSCAGGYTSTQATGGISTCVACVDTPGWTTVSGANCFDSGTSCNDTLVDGLSSDEACCKCGGGQKEATQFAYYVAPVVLGSTTIVGYPVPRTATKYSINKGCTLLEHGMAINGETGELEVVPGETVGRDRTEGFTVTCTITAQQTAELAASATLTVQVDQGVSYGADPLAFDDSLGALQYVPTVQQAPGNVWTFDTLQCNPSDATSMVRLAQDGTLTWQAAQNGGVSDLGTLATSDGGICSARAVPSLGSLETVRSRFVAVNPKVWTSFSYVASWEVTVGQAAPTARPTEPTQAPRLLPPSSYTGKCTDGVTLDVVTGQATYQGYHVFDMDLTSGSVRLAPEEALASTFVATSGRGKLMFSCEIFALYQYPPFGAGPFLRTVVDMTVQDDTCWPEAAAEPKPKFKSYVSLPPTSDSACRWACRSDKTWDGAHYIPAELAGYVNHVLPQKRGKSEALLVCQSEHNWEKQCSLAEKLKEKGVTCRACLEGSFYHKAYDGGDTCYKFLIATGRAASVERLCELRRTWGYHDLTTRQPLSPEDTEDYKRYIRRRNPRIENELRVYIMKFPWRVADLLSSAATTDAAFWAIMDVGEDGAPKAAETRQHAGAATAAPSTLTSSSASSSARSGVPEEELAIRARAIAQRRAIEEYDQKVRLQGAPTPRAPAPKKVEDTVGQPAGSPGPGNRPHKPVKEWVPGHTTVAEPALPPRARGAPAANTRTDERAPKAGLAQKVIKMGIKLDKSKKLEKVSDCSERKTCIRITGLKNYLNGRYCYFGENRYPGGLVFLKEGITSYESFWFHRRGANGDWVLQRPGDYQNASAAYMAFGGDLINEAFADGRTEDFFRIGGSFVRADLEVETLHCDSPNMTFADDRVTAIEEGVQTLVVDDPSTTETINDFWLHPCHCAPPPWGQNLPVTSESFSAIPAGSQNRFRPPPFPIVTGELSCELSALINIIYETEVQAVDAEECQSQCSQTQACKYFLAGEVLNAKLCRLFSQCTELWREIGLSGTLYSFPKTVEVCAISDPVLCWHTTKRRQSLRAYYDTASTQSLMRAPCLDQTLFERCDDFLFIGGLGVEECSPCRYMDSTQAGLDNILSKRLLPKRFDHGTMLKVGCWGERYTSLANKLPTSGFALTCATGSWFAASGSKGLANFQCSAYIQVVNSYYKDLDVRNWQEPVELFFYRWFATGISLERQHGSSESLGEFYVQPDADGAPVEWLGNGVSFPCVPRHRTFAERRMSLAGRRKFRDVRTGRCLSTTGTARVHEGRYAGSMLFMMTTLGMLQVSKYLTYKS
ncbi:unnamed protein product [Symbiodinium sp. KB8]|nr:unnamed protein product [Symbiodinium sp. KB8]